MRRLDPKYLICPDCGSELTLNEGRYQCGECGRIYPTIDGINILLPSKLDSQKVNEDKYWAESDVDGAHAPLWRSLIHKSNDILFLYEQIIPNYIFKGKVLEIGSGTCWASSLIKLYGCADEVYASDISINALRGGLELSRIFEADIDHYFCLDCENIPFIDSYFDCILGIAILHHLSDPVKALEEIRRCLKPGGFYLGLGEEMAGFLLRRVYRKICSVGERERRLGIIEATYSFNRWRNMLKSAGFRNFKVTLYKDDKYRWSFMRNMYYKIVKHIPDTLLKLLVSNLHIYAEKN